MTLCTTYFWERQNTWYNIWIKHGFLSVSALTKIKQRLHKVIVPSGLGRLPPSVDIGTFLTAEQWKNWTLYFSIYCLHGLLPNEHIECWRHFVLACHKLYPYVIPEVNITIADGLLLRFCKKVLQIYGRDVLTPNMHMHCHLGTYIKEFGPMHSYWLFPFERYNGILGQQPTNNRSVEIQLMRRFLSDNSHLNLFHQAEQWPHADIFLDLIPDVTTTINSEASTLDITSCSKKIQWKGQKICSELDRAACNCYVMAESLFTFTSSGEHPQETRPAKLLQFMQHSIILPDSNEPQSHIFAHATWPMPHPKRELLGKPAEIWCDRLDEPDNRNFILPVSNITNRVLFCVDDDLISGDKVLIIIPVIAC